MTAPVLTTKLDREAPDAKARAEHNQTLASDLRASVAEAALGGPDMMVTAASKIRKLAYSSSLV